MSPRAPNIICAPSNNWTAGPPTVQTGAPQQQGVGIGIDGAPRLRRVPLASVAVRSRTATSSIRQEESDFGIASSAYHANEGQAGQQQGVGFRFWHRCHLQQLPADLATRKTARSRCVDVDIRQA